MNEEKVMLAVKKAVENEGHFIVRGEFSTDGSTGFTFHFKTAKKKATP